MACMGRRYSDPSGAAPITTVQQLRGSSHDTFHIGRHSIPSVDLCPTCQNLFHRPDKPANEVFRATIVSDLFTDARSRCRICDILKQEHMSRGFRGPEAPRIGDHLQLAPGDSASTLRLYLQSHSEDKHYIGGCVVMEFWMSITGSKEPRVVSTRKARDHRRWRSDTLCPLVRSEHTSDEVCFKQIQKWLQTCTLQHTMCQQTTSHNQTSYMPTRLISVHDKPHLVSTASETFRSRHVHYATLSHRWTKATTAKLLRSNSSEFLQKIHTTYLTPVFRDAINATRRLGLQYIWIDALCIVQDDPEDWTKEASAMNLVYKHAYCNLGASAAVNKEVDATRTVALNAQGDTEDTLGGLFTSRSASKHDMVHLSVTRREHSRAYYGFHEDLRPTLAHDRLMSRGWIFQERLLSPRSVYFGEQLTWECSELLANESFPEGLERNVVWASRWVDLLPQRIPNMLDGRGDQYRTYGNDIRINESYRMWLALVARYSTCELTYRSDTLPAVSGLAKSFQFKLKDEYLAGIWRKDMIRGLLWKTLSWRIKGDPPSPIYYAPSWSWATAITVVDFILEHDQFPNYSPSNDMFIADIQEAAVTPAGSDPMGPLKDGFVRISGDLRPNQRSTVQMTYLGSSFEQYDHGSDVERDCSDTFFLLLNCHIVEPFHIRGLILKPTGRTLDEYQRIGAFDFHPDDRVEFHGFDWKNLHRQVVRIV